MTSLASIAQRTRRRLSRRTAPRPASSIQCVLASSSCYQGASYAHPHLLPPPHQDVNKEAGAEDMFKKVGEAYEVRPWLNWL